MNCTGCGRPMIPKPRRDPPPGVLVHGGRGLCTPCAKHQRYLAKKETGDVHEEPEPPRPTTEQNRAALAAWITKRRENWPDDGTLKGVVP